MTGAAQIASASACSADLAKRLNVLARCGEWPFPDRDARDHVHAMYQYPAMMVPLMQRRIIETLIGWDPEIRSVYDPFVGAGTVLTETILQGLDFFGGDINPLAVLIARAKADIFDIAAMRTGLALILKRVSAAPAARTGGGAEFRFANIDKWFEPHVRVGLTALRSAIQACPTRRERCFWWVALADVVRVASNSRASTVKLHVRPLLQRNARPDPVTVFAQVAARNLDAADSQTRLLHERGFLRAGRYRGRVAVRVADARDVAWDRPADALITSPPYGDNHTTVTYGQASYLALNWIDLDDIDGLDADAAVASVASTRRLDTASLGGSLALRPARRDRAESVLARSAALRDVRDRLAAHPADRWKRVISFYADLDIALDRLIDAVRPGAVLAFTTGNRTVGGERIAMADIVAQLAAGRADPVACLRRPIPATGKRMPPRNASSPTVHDEAVLVLRRYGDATQQPSSPNARHAHDDAAIQAAPVA